MTPKARLSYIDLGKGILILLVVFAHFVSAADRVGIGDDFVFIKKIIMVYTPFYMPAFFMLSGYCTNYKKPIKDFIIGNIKTIFLPLVIYDTLTRILWNISTDTPWSIKGILTEDNFIFDTKTWFLNALLVARFIVYYIINKIIPYTSHIYISAKDGLKHVLRPNLVFLIVIFVIFLLGIVLQHTAVPDIFVFKKGFISVLFVGLCYYMKQYNGDWVCNALK